MNKTFSAGKLLLASALTMLMLGSCTKNYLVVDLDGEESGTNSTNSSDDQNTKGDLLVTFHATVENRMLTRAMSPMAANIQSWLSAYLSNTTQTLSGTPVASGNYITTSPGVLTGMQDYKMYLNNNIYNFYAVSCNANVPAPQFNNGISQPLSNGIDYLWWRALNQDVKSSQVNIPVVYQHAATQIVVAVTEGTNITLNKILSATVTPPKPGATMNLATGVIAPESTYTQPALMGITDFTVQYIMLPVRSTSPMTLTFEVLVNGENSARTYVSKLSLPDGELSAGNSYLFKAVINENTVSFPNVSIKEWTEVDESGNPLYPEQN